MNIIKRQSIKRTRQSWSWRSGSVAFKDSSRCFCWLTILSSWRHAAARCVSSSSTLLCHGHWWGARSRHRRSRFRPSSTTRCSRDLRLLTTLDNDVMLTSCCGTSSSGRALRARCRCSLIHAFSSSTPRLNWTPSPTTHYSNCTRQRNIKSCWTTVAQNSAIFPQAAVGIGFKSPIPIPYPQPQKNLWESQRIPPYPQNPKILHTHTPHPVSIR